jgi:hypothetical protein
MKLEKEKLKKIGEYIFIFSGLTILFYFIFVEKYIHYTKLFGKTRYTIGQVIEIRMGRNGRFVNYSYFVNGKEHTNSSPLRTFKQLGMNIGDRLYTKFSLEDNDVSVLLNCCRIEDQELHAPAEGWTFDELKKINPDFIDNFQPFWVFSYDDPDIYPLPPNEQRKEINKWEELLDRK